MQHIALNSFIPKKRVAYTICFFLFCLIDQRVKTASGLDGTYEFFRNLTGIVMAVLIFSHYTREEFRRLQKPFLLWTILGLPVSIAIFISGISRCIFPAAWFLMVLGIFLFGYIVIYTALLLKEKKYPLLDRRLLILWGLLMLVMIVSRSDHAWPFFYFFMFGLLFLTPYTKEEQEDLYQGVLNGILLSFVVFQAYCCIFRPYDVVRYVGIYTNSNIAGLYYLEVLGALMAKYLYTVKRGVRLWEKCLCWLGLGIIYSFLFMCIGRTAWIVAILLSMVFLLAIHRSCQNPAFLQEHAPQGRGLQKHLTRENILFNGLTLLLCACIMFPCTFGIVRYTPPFFHHPVWFWGEYSEEKVHSWDAWDSEKYIDLDELLTAAVGRLKKTIEDMLSESPLAISSKAAGTTGTAGTAEATGTTGADGTDNTDMEDNTNAIDPREEMAVLSYEEAENGMLVRKTIYSHYFHNLNLWGHRQDDQGFQLTGQYWIGHAHNIYLQYGTDFGIIALLLFLVLSGWACVSLVRSFLKSYEPEYMGYFLFALIPLAFGMFEYCWGVSTWSILLLFLAWGRAIRRS